MTGPRLAIVASTLVIIGLALTGAGAALASNVTAAGPSGLGGMMDGHWGGFGHGGMMGGYVGRSMLNGGPQPGDAGFVAGTPDAPRVLDVIAGSGYTFTPSEIMIQRGETVTFRITTMGPLVHEFMVGPAEAVAADREGTLEVEDIGMMETRSLTYTFDGSGSYAFACHAPGHYEAGMHGTIRVVG